jgi:hypothetical protein
VSLALFVSDPQATPTTASAIKSADAFLNLMVLPFVGILVSPPRYAERDSQTWLAPECDRQYDPSTESRQHPNSQRLLVASNPRRAWRGPEVDDLVGYRKQFLVVAGADDTRTAVGAASNGTGY